MVVVVVATTVVGGIVRGGVVVAGSVPRVVPGAGGPDVVVVGLREVVTVGPGANVLGAEEVGATPTAAG